ncbi:BTB/POZ protein [Hypomontagnella monticulosa]|nr:BTB/POZ protein [Hypomontagnella monticulosa]
MAAQSGVASLGGWLLDSQHLSDVQIKCGEQTWLLHKAVLCRKSAWFKAVFITKPDIGRLQNGCVTVGECTPEVMEAVIYWIYTDKIKDQNLDTENVVYAAYIDLFRAANFFVVPDLIDACLLELQLRLQKKAIKFQRAFRRFIETKTPIGYLVDEFQARGVMDGAKMAWESNLETLKGLWLDFFEATMYWALWHRSALRLGIEHPSFHKKMDEEIFRRQGANRNLRDLPNRYCAICGCDPFSSEDGYYAEVWVEDPAEGMLGACDKCGNTPRLFKAEPYHLSPIDDYAMRVGL